MKDRFLFFENFKKIADTLPDDLRLKFYDALTSYVFDDEEPEAPVIKSLIIAIKPSLDKEEKRGGNHNPAGQNQHSKDKQNNIGVKDGQKNNSLGQKEVKVGQSGQSFLETETGNGNRKQIWIHRTEHLRMIPGRMMPEKKVRTQMKMNRQEQSSDSR